MEQENRLGIFSLPQEMIQLQPDLVMQIMGSCIPLMIVKGEQNTICYTAISPDFDHCFDVGNPTVYQPKIDMEMNLFEGFVKAEVTEEDATD